MAASSFSLRLLDDLSRDGAVPVVDHAPQKKRTQSMATAFTTSARWLKRFVPLVPHHRTVFPNGGSGDLGTCIAPESAVRTASTDTVAGWEAVCLRLLLSCGDQYMQIAPECHRRRMAFAAMIAASAASWPLLDGPGRLRSWACSTWRTVSTALATGTPESRVTRVNPALLCSATCA